MSFQHTWWLRWVNKKRLKTQAHYPFWKTSSILCSNYFELLSSSFPSGVLIIHSWHFSEWCQKWGGSRDDSHPYPITEVSLWTMHCCLTSLTLQNLGLNVLWQFGGKIEKSNTQRYLPACQGWETGTVRHLQSIQAQTQCIDLTATYRGVISSTIGVSINILFHFKQLHFKITDIKTVKPRSWAIF